MILILYIRLSYLGGHFTVNSYLTKAELSDLPPVHFALAEQELPGVVVWVDLVVFFEHHDGPYCPVVIVQEHATFRLLENLAALFPLQGPFSANALTLCPKLEIVLGDELDLLVRCLVLPVEADANAMRVRVVTDHLIQVVAQVIAHWVPHAVLKVN